MFQVGCHGGCREISVCKGQIKRSNAINDESVVAGLAPALTFALVLAFALGTRQPFVDVILQTGKSISL